MTRPKIAAGEAPDTVRSLRARVGLTQAQAASRARISVRTASDLESGGNVELGSIQAYAAALGIETSVLVAAMEREVVVRKVSAFSRSGPRQTCRPPRSQGAA